MHVVRFRLVLAAMAVAACTCLAGCAKDIPRFVPPAERPVAASELPWPEDRLLALAYHHIEDGTPNLKYVSVRTDQFIEQLAWLRENGYRAVSVDQVLQAHRGGPPLPPRAVLLTFDDGYRSFYTRVFPILKAYGWPAVLAPVGAWIDTPADRDVNFGGEPVPREMFLTLEQVAEMSRSGLVEIGAHTDDLHHGVRANPQGSELPAAAALTYDGTSGTYERPGQYAGRIARDVSRITEKIRRVTGKAPRVWVWPYGAAQGAALKIVAEDGYELALTLDAGLGRVDRLMSTPRVLLSGEASTENVANAIVGIQNVKHMRVAHVDLDYVYDPDPAQMERNLGALVQRIADMQISAVFLQAFADPAGDGLVRSVYFPNRLLPVRADLFGRAAWQLRTRAQVAVFAWMPVLAFDLDPALPRVARWSPKHGAVVDAKQYRRLSPFSPEVRARIGALYEDLAYHAIFDGILFHDDAILADDEDAGEAAIAIYRAAGLPDSIPALRADAGTLQRWTRFKSRYLIDFTAELAARVRAIRGPQVMTARNIFAAPVLHPESEAWFAQNLDDFLAAYDWTVPMAMPLMEKVPAAQVDRWLDRLVDEVAKRPGALEKTIFELQSRDWGKSNAPVDPARLAGWMQRIQRRGAPHFGYYPDDFAQDHPRLEVIRPALSNAWYPYR